MSTVEQTFTSSFHSMLSALPSVRDGDADAIHDARVAARRVRAVLPVLVGRQPAEAWRDLGRAIKKMGRALGEARDVDVSLDLLRDVEARSPMTAPAAASMRARLLPEQTRSRRALIKRLERVDVAGLSQIAAQAAGRRHLVPWRADRFAPRVGAAIVKRAGQARAAIDHATGVYFPRRAHALRVALKKLRYLVELIDARDGTRRAHLRTLKSAQETLGQIHDREVLAGRLATVAGDGEIPNAAALRDVLDAESRTLFDRYLALREGLLDTCQSLLDRWRPRVMPVVTNRVLTLGALAVPSAAMVLFANRARKAHVANRACESGGPVQAPQPISSSRTRKPAAFAASVSNPLAP